MKRTFWPSVGRRAVMLNIIVGVVRLRTAEVGVKRMASSTPVKSGVTVTVPVPSGRTGSVTVTKRAKAYPTKMSGSTVSVLLTETLTMGRISMMNQDWVMSYSETAVPERATVRLTQVVCVTGFPRVSAV